jgi:type III restriction enzyme
VSKKAIANQIIRDVEAVFSEQQIGKEVLRKVAENAIEYCAEKLTGTVIPIPEAVISPQSVSNYRIDDFDLDTRNLNLRPSDDAMIGRELPEGGRQVEFDGDYIELLAKPADTPEQDVAKYIIIKDNIDYQKCGKLILSLIAQAEKHFLSYLTAEDTDKVMRQQARNIAEYIYAQMNEHFHESDVEYIADEIRPFSRIEGSFGSKIKADAIYDYNVTVRKGEVSQKVFKGFNKACHTLYKFDSSSELEFARVLEQDSGVLKWLRPASRQFNIHWGKHRQNYEPDFIVETAGKIYMCEVKAAKETQSDEVQEKGRAGAEYCRTVSGWNEENGGKPWEYAIVADKSIQANSSFKYLIDTRTPLEILMDGG